MSTHLLERWRRTAASYDVAGRVAPERSTALQKSIYVLALFAAAVWTLLMWGAYGLLGLSDEALRSGTSWFGVDVQMLEQLLAALGGVQQWGAAIMLSIWAVGVVVIAAGSWLGSSVLRVLSKAATSRA